MEGLECQNETCGFHFEVWILLPFPCSQRHILFNLRIRTVASKSEAENMASLASQTTLLDILANLSRVHSLPASLFCFYKTTL